jgi:hypothetical protein
MPGTTEQGSWQPSRLEYRFACGAPAESGDQLTLAAKDYPGPLRIARTKEEAA